MADEIEVEGPDGEVFAFPAGTSDGVMRTALIKHYQGQKRQPQAAPAPTASGGGFLDTLRRLGDGAEGAGAVTPPVRPPPAVQAGAAIPYAESIGKAVGAIGTAANRGVRMLADGATLGTVNKAAAALNTGFGMLGDYEQELADQRAIDAETEAAMPLAAGGLKAAGNAAAMTALQMAGVPVFGAAGAGLGKRVAQAAATNGALGFGAGLVNEDDPTDKVGSAAKEGSIHFGVGAAGPLAGAALGAGAGLVARNLAGRFDPEAYAAQRVGRAVRDSGRSADEIADTMAAAQADGLPFVAADAMGHAGRRALASISKQPGPQREVIVEAMEQRQAGQARRLQDTLRDGFGTRESAPAAAERLTTARDTAANAAYGEARREAGAVDVSGALRVLDDTLAPGATPLLDPGSRLRDDTIEAALRRVRGMLATSDERLTGFEAVGRVRQEVQDMIERVGPGTNRGRLLGQVERELGRAMANASPPQAAADRAYAAASREIEAVGRGGKAARGETAEDVIAAFQALPAAEQEAFRAGYMDPYLRSLQGTPQGTNAARPLTADAVRQEFPAVAAPGQAERMMRRIDGENAMFRTRNAATGGSTTAENIADMAGEKAMDVSALHDLVTFNAPGLTRRAAHAVANTVTGATEAGREATGRLLLSSDPQALAAAIRAAMEADARRDGVANAIGRGAANYAGSAYRGNR